MINEDRVKELYSISYYETHKARENKQMGQYYRADYVWKEMIKSFFAGSICFMLLLLLWGLKHQTGLAGMMTGSSIIDLAITVLLLYLVFMIIYILITYLVFQNRYRKGRKELKKYTGHLKKVDQMYNREEKLKQN